MFTPSPPYIKSLGNGFSIKSIATVDDVERVARFNAAAFGPQEESMSRALILDHPDTRAEHWLYAEEDSTGLVVASLCLIPWRWNYAGVELRSGELGICATLEAYRNRGLIRALTVRHKELLREGGFHLSHIQGIPYFYRQFGYEYALPLEGGWEIELRQLPDDMANGYTFRQAVIEDIPVLSQLYNEARAAFDISSVRGEGVWRYFFEAGPETGTGLDIFLLLDPVGQPAGYWFVQRHGFGEGLNVYEASRLNHVSAGALLSILKGQALERGKPYIRLIVPDGTPLIRTAADFGARDAGRYQWQLHAPDTVHLLRAIAPVLEQRIASSMFAGLSDTLTLCLYRETVVLHFEDGRLVSVETTPVPVNDGEIRIPPLLFPVLVFGWRTRAELAERYPDFLVWERRNALIDVLFPKMTSSICTNY